jgi:hypothetical protein
MSMENSMERVKQKVQRRSGKCYGAAASLPQQFSAGFAFCGWLALYSYFRMQNVHSLGIAFYDTLQAKKMCGPMLEARACLFRAILQK